MAFILASIYIGDTLRELKNSFLLGEQEREGIVSNHVSPFIDTGQLGALMQQARFTCNTLDIEDISIRYETPFTLMRDLQGMAENNCNSMRRSYTPLSTFLATAASYTGLSILDGVDVWKDGFPATFQVLYVIGWKDPVVSKASELNGNKK